MNIAVDAWVGAMNTMPPELIWVMLLLSCFAAILVLNRFFGAAGLFVYVSIAIIAANIQVLKIVQFGVYAEPVALGTILFATAFLATDILGERFGGSIARKAVYTGMCAYFLFTVLMLITLGFTPMTEEQAGEALGWAVPNHGHIAAIFMPQPIFFLAGMAAFLVSQLNDIWLFGWLKKMFNGRHLWLRNNVSTIISALIDSIVFSLLAWIVLAPEPLPLETVIFTFILGTYWLRVIVALLDTPIIYLARKWVKPGTDEGNADDQQIAYGM